MLCLRPNNHFAPKNAGVQARNLQKSKSLFSGANLRASFQGGYTPWKINMEHINHPFRKENDLPNLHDYVPC